MNILKHFFLLSFLVLSLSACSAASDSVIQAGDPTQLDTENIEISTSYISSDISTVAGFAGKPSLIVWGGTYCPHCKESIPELEKLYTKYQDDMNVQINVIDNKKFDTYILPQNSNPALTFDQVTQYSCGYVPAFALIDAQGAMVLKSCGGEKTLADVEALLSVMITQ
ncbi:MAG: thioredoxin domain-containing protein [Patescibacteria group bacterium]|nr:thioredoxin domain-containing protein [Patescibacteria group bacterium]